MLVTSLCWRLSDGDWFQMLMALFSFCDFFNVLNRSPTFQTCHQYIWSPTSVTNIDIAKSTPKPTQNQPEINPNRNPKPTHYQPKPTSNPPKVQSKVILSEKHCTHCEKISVNKMFTVSLFCLLSSTWPSLCWWRVIRLLRWRLAAVGSKEWTSPGY